MKILLISAILAVAVCGCGSELTAGGAGVASGFAASETIKGMQADLERRQQALIARYNQLIEAGAKAETLEDLRQKIDDLETAKQTAAAVPAIAKTNWADPAAAGGAIGMITALGYAWLKRRDLQNTVGGVRAFRAGLDESSKQKLDKTLLDKKAVT